MEQAGWIHSNKVAEGTIMATLTVQSLDEKVRGRLRVRAALTGRSIEAKLNDNHGILPLN